ncbi:MAG: acetyl-CoA carboxylase biotin carboxyl carrier protein [Gammaproteobacteria bacterium]
MDLRKLKTILELFEESKQISELEINEGEDKIRLCKTPVAAPPPHPVSAPPAPHSAQHAPAAAPPAPANAEAETEGKIVKAPMVGAFYRASSPETPPFVRIGQAVEAGETLCIIEAMKLMNEIPSPAAGKIKSILVENGAPVGYGDALFVIE